MSGILELSFLVMILGAKGFTRGGLPFSSTTRLRGGGGEPSGRPASRRASRAPGSRTGRATRRAANTSGC